MNRNEEAHAACLNILHDNKDSAPRIAELCTLSRALGTEIDELRAQLAACAAGPWRFDVENAPKDGSEVLIQFTDRRGKNKLDFAYWLEEDGHLPCWETKSNGQQYAGALLAFAIPNPPQVTP